MSINAIGTSSPGLTANRSEFTNTLALRVADIKSQTFGSLMSLAFGGSDASNKAGGSGSSSGIDALFADRNSANDLLSALTGSSSVGGNGLSISGRNTALYDPESAYKMMTEINNKDVTYKAQFSELSQMQSWLTDMQKSGDGFAKLDASTDDAAIKQQLQAFADQYNDWTRRFDADMQRGGLLADTQAAKVARYELEQSIKNIFHGATDGLRGLQDLGFSIDPHTGLASLDTAKLDSALSNNKSGVVGTLQEFGLNFAKSAELLNAADNFIPRQLGNLDRVIDYIEDNKASLQAEFGLGDAAKPTDQIAKALAAYNQAHRI